MTFNIQPILENNYICLHPLSENDFDELFKVASDPKIWEQHPNKNRWKKEVFTIFFEGAIQSKGAFKILDRENNQCIGCTRFYDYNIDENSILIGYTFYATKCWGKGINKMVKELMLDYIFNFVSKVYFHIGAENIRSQIAINRIGAEKVDIQEITYFGEEPEQNYVYQINKEFWLSL